MSETGKVLDAFAVKRDSHYITNMWANITHPNHRQDIHVHPNCFLSGLVYIKTPINCGPTLFASPRKFTKNFEPRYTAKNELNSDFIIIPAEKGRMLIWPEPRSACGGTGHGRRNRGPDHRPLQHHDPWPHRTIHGEFELELTNLEVTAASARGACDQSSDRDDPTLEVPPLRIKLKLSLVANFTGPGCGPTRAVAGYML